MQAGAANCDGAKRLPCRSSKRLSFLCEPPNAERYGKPVSLSVSPEASEAQVPRFLLQPIVENAIRHGIARCPNGGEVSITACIIEGQLRIDIENDRMEGLLQSGDEGNGLGLANTKTRLEKLYGEQGRVTVATAKNNRFLVSM